MKKLAKHIALLLALVLVLALVPKEITVASARTYTLHTNEALYQWVLNLNKNMGLLENGIQSGRLAHQAGAVATIGNVSGSNNVIFNYTMPNSDRSCVVKVISQKSVNTDEIKKLQTTCIANV